MNSGFYFLVPSLTEYSSMDLAWNRRYLGKVLRVVVKGHSLKPVRLKAWQSSLSKAGS